MDDFHETGKKLHVLVNNAGVMFNPKDTKKQYTSDNFEMTMGTNHLGKLRILFVEFPTANALFNVSEVH